MSGDFACPKTEVAWVRYYNNNKDLKYVITSNKTREYYFLYEIAEKQIKLGKGKTPKDLELKYNVLLNLCK